ncbi:MAG: hypothetical protein ACK559_31265, partial [bacterium]
CCPSEGQGQQPAGLPQGPAFLLVATTGQTAQEAQRNRQATDPPGAEQPTELAGGQHARGPEASRSARA